MKFYKLFFPLVTVGLIVSCCGKPEPEPVKETVTVSAAPSSLAFPTEGGSQTLTVSSNGLWYARNEGSWFSVSATSGYGNGTVEVQAGANAGDERQGSIVFETADQKLTVNVSQAKYTAPVSETRTIKEVRALYKGVDYTVKDDWTIEGVVISDYRRDTDGGLNNYTSARTLVISDGEAGLMLYCAAENKEFARGQKVKVRLKDQVLSVYGDGVIQVNGLPLDRIEAVGTATLTPKEITVEQLLTGDYECMYVAVKDVQVRQDYVGKTFASDSQNGTIPFEGKNGDSFDLFTSRYAVFRNETVPTGSGTLKGIAGKYGTRYQITISEKNDYAGLTGERFQGSSFFSLETTDATVSGDAGTFDIHVASNVAWTASSSDPAFTLSPVSGTGAGQVTVTYGDNPSTTQSRTATVTFRTEDAGVAQKELKFTVVQQPYEALVQSAVQPWLELPAVPSQDGLAFFSHDMTYNNQQVRNYSFLLDLSARVSLWVAYPLYKGMTSGTSRTDKWEYDPLVPKRYQGEAYKAYGVAGYDRGHQLPSADRLCNTSANEQTFYFTNMTPQNSDLNQGLWEQLESHLRGQISSSDTLYVVTGCVLSTTADPTLSYIKDNRGASVAVPKAYYKVVLKYKAGAPNGGYSAIGFWMENKAYGNTPLTRTFCRSVDEIETLTGMDFFHNLNSTYEKEAEARYDASSWGL